MRQQCIYRHSPIGSTGALADERANNDAVPYMASWALLPGADRAYDQEKATSFMQCVNVYRQTCYQQS